MCSRGQFKFSGTLHTLKTKLILLSLSLLLVNSCATQQTKVTTKHGTTATSLDGFFYETSAGRQMLPPLKPTQDANGAISAHVTMSDGRVVTLSITPEGKNSEVSLTAQPDSDIIKWGLAV